MPDLESEYLQLRQELVAKYGAEALSTAENKALALLLLTACFKRVPEDANFYDELAILATPFENMSKPEVRVELNKLQRDFRENRFLEIIEENGDSSFIHDVKNDTLEKKISAVKSLGLTASTLMNREMGSGYVLGELVGDLCRVYVVEYRGFRETTSHTILHNTRKEPKDSDFRKQTTANRFLEKNLGCIGLMIMFISLVTCLINFVNGHY